MTWNNKTKELISYLFATVALVVGFGLSIAGFIVEPTGIISESVLWLLSQCLVFAGGIAGISLHVETQLHKVEATILKKLKSDKSQESESDKQR